LRLDVGPRLPPAAFSTLLVMKPKLLLAAAASPVPTPISNRSVDGKLQWVSQWT
jgi:hypothetical protein